MSKVSPRSDCKTNRSVGLHFLTNPTLLSVRETDCSDGLRDKADTALGPVEVGSFSCWGDHLFDLLANNTCDPCVCGGKGGRKKASSTKETSLAGSHSISCRTAGGCCKWKKVGVSTFGLAPLFSKAYLYFSLSTQIQRACKFKTVQKNLIIYLDLL